mmetsp:Transcript_68668/g.147122  ORF Transcript_68668/g.147122 Transcript_68668/m.147122 type:complete len:439 (-) Transcript_68668:111-1427(-)
MNIGLSHGHRDSCLTMLLRDCLGGNARALLIANISPEAEQADESVKTLTFAQQMLAVKNVASINRVEQDQSALLQMRQRHSECIKILQEKMSDAREDEQEERRKLQQEMEDLNKRLLTKESAERTLEDMRDAQNRKIDEMREEMTQVMSHEIQRIRWQSMQDLDSLRQSVEKHVSHLDSSSHQRHAEEHEARVRRLHTELSDASKAQRSAEEEASELRVRLASAEERGRMLQARQEELRRERSDVDEERKVLRLQGEQQWQRLTAVERELQKFKSEAEVQRTELARLSNVRTQEAETMRQEREAGRAREAELHREAVDLDRSLDEARREAEVQALRVEGEQREAVSQLRLQIERLEGEAAARVEQLQQARQRRSQLEAECVASQQREEQLRQQAALELRRAQEELEEATQRERELMHMLNEVQDSIIVSNTGPDGAVP